jgi:hypothetical protein
VLGEALQLAAGAAAITGARIKMENPKTVWLKNSTQEAEGLVKVVMLQLRKLFEGNPIIFYELVTKCRDSSHEFFGETGKELMYMQLVQHDGNSIHSSIRNVVLSAVTGEELEMRLGNPLQ